MPMPPDSPYQDRFPPSNRQARTAAQSVGKVMDISITTPLENWPTEDAAHIFGELLEEWAEEFLLHNHEYQGQERQFGKMGELIEMTRKLSKLKAAWYDGADTSEWRESPDTVLKELISHAFLAFVSIRHPRGSDGPS